MTSSNFRNLVSPLAVILTGSLAVELIAGCATSAYAEESKIPLTFSGGHETDPKDHGRPVVLVAGALGVKPEVFRDAFSRVHPSPAGIPPSGERQRENKAA